MKWVRDKAGALVPALKSGEEKRADKAAEAFEFDAGEREQYMKLEAALRANPALRKKFVKRMRRMEAASRMSPTIKTRGAR